MRTNKNSALVVALAIGVVLVLILAGSAATGTRMGGGMMGGGWMGNGWMGGSAGGNWMGVSAGLTIGFGVLLGWLIFGRKT